MGNNELDTPIREAIGRYVRVLKKKGRTIKHIVEDSMNVANSKNFSEATLVRCYSPEKKGDKKYYPIAIETLGIIADTLRVIVINEIKKSEEFKEVVAAYGIDLDQKFSEREMSYRQTIQVDSIKEGKFYTWEETKRLELECSKMYVITPDLSNANKITEDLIKATKENPNKVSCFMLTDRKGRHNREKMLKKIKDHNDPDLEKRIQILTLYKMPLYNPDLAMDELQRVIPLPLNLAIYFDVINPFTNKWEEYIGGQSLVHEHEKEGADYMFNRFLIEPIMDWFEAVWEAFIEPKQQE